jgi:hypothetical protein
MRVLILGLVSSLAISVVGTAFADPIDTSSAAMAAPEPMAQTTVPQATQTEAQGAGSATQPVSANGEKLICHHPVHEGTVLPQEVCLTKAAWERIRLREQKNVNDWQMRGYQAAIH